MSLINQYLEKSGAKDQVGGLEADVPPVLKSGGTRRRHYSPYRLSMAVLVAGIALVGVYLFRLPTTIADNGRIEIDRIQAPSDSVADVSSRPESPDVARPANEAVATGSGGPGPQLASATVASESPLNRPEVQPSAPVSDEPRHSPAPDELRQAMAEDYRWRRPVADYRDYRQEYYRPDAAPDYQDRHYSPPEPEKPVAIVRPTPVVTVRDPGEGGQEISPRERASGYFQLALAAQHDGKTKQAENLYRQVLKALPDHIDALNNLAVLLMDQARPAEAEELLRRLLATSPRHAGAYNNLGLLHLRGRRYDAAQTNFIRALELEPTSRTALVNLAWLARQQGDFAAAGEYFERLIRHDLHDREVLLAYAGLLEQQESVGRALEIYRLALESAEQAGEQSLVRQIRDRVRLLKMYQEDAVTR